jgi:hypothetical protein
MGTGGRGQETGRRRQQRCGVLLLVLFPPFSFLLAGAPAQDPPLPEEETFFTAVRENMARANREQRFYAYKERRTELHTNPFGRLGTGGMSLYEVTPGPTASVMFRRLLEKDGKPVADSKPERQERRIRTGRSSIDDTVATLNFAIDGRETVGGRTAIVVRFDPRPESEPETREGKLAKSFKGRIWVDEAAREVMRVEATAIDDLSYGFGLVAKLHKGAIISLVRERVDSSIWLPTAIRFKGSGRALLLRKLNIDFAVEWFDYRRM